LDGSSEPTREDWDLFFADKKPLDGQVRDLVFKLHNNKQHIQVINVIEAALVSGCSQTWMYDVLATTMEIVDRPKAEIERVLLSRIDFTATDVPSMLYSAAYLNRFGAKNKALSLYRQASSLAPERPEPYILGLGLAQELNDYDAIGWAAAGVLTYAWVNDHQALHRKAEIAVEDARRELLAKGDRLTAQDLFSRIENARNRDLMIRLTWNGPGDLDLVVEEPLGTVCSPTRPHSPGGGVLVHDGSGPNPENSYDSYVCALAASGTYNIHVRHIRGQIVGKRATLTAIRYAGTDRESKKTIAIPLSSDDVVVRVPLKMGRRKTANAPTDRLTTQPVPRITRQPSDRRRAELDSRAAANRFRKSRRPANPPMQPAGAGGVVGFQPIIAVIPEGIILPVSAVVSADRRFVRLTLNPSFSALADVATFSFFSGP
jgi:hypothetical protein